MSHRETESDRAGRLVESSQGRNVESFVVARGGTSEPGRTDRRPGGPGAGSVTSKAYQTFIFCSNYNVIFATRAAAVRDG